LTPKAPYFLFSAEKTSSRDKYYEGFDVSKLFIVSCTGIITARDSLAIDFDTTALRTKIEDFRDIRRSDADTRSKFFPGKASGKYPPGDSRGWSLGNARKNLRDKTLESYFSDILYRPFDTRKIYYSDDLIDWGREAVMRHIRNGVNIALLTPRMTADEYSPLVSDSLVSNKTGSRYDQTYVFPLYLHPAPDSLETERRINFEPNLYAAIREKAGLSGTAGDELKVFDYVYGALHSPDYRRAYSQFLKIDFPRIPYPASPEVFAHVAEKGGRLRRLHLMDREVLGETPYPFKGEGAGEVTKVAYSEDGRVRINHHQGFEGVPVAAWDFHIGGYQPAQKWLKDRKGRMLSFEDVRHYQRIIKVLVETARIMGEIHLPLEVLS
jgi:predicted helicase